MSALRLNRRTLLAFGAAWATLAPEPSPARTKAPARSRQRARYDAKLSARVISRKALHYRAGADPKLDRPGHVRAGSGLAWLGARLAVIQDDANFVAVVDPKSATTDAIALDAGPNGKRLFDDDRKTKQLKTDLEACFTVPHGDITELIAFGSGSKAIRERILILRYDTARNELKSQRLVDASSLYANLRAMPGFGGSELNLEGAVLRDDELLLFQRGNGAIRDGHRPASAVGSLSFRALVRYLDADGRTVAPGPERITSYDLGAARKVPYTFTDAALATSGNLVFLASAEDSDSTVTDGAVLGTYIGSILRNGSARVGPLLDERGKLLQAKAEGIAIDRRDPRKAWAVLDKDDPAVASELLELALSFSA